MLKLMKYEFRKTWLTKLVLLGITAALEVLFLVSLYANFEDTLVIAIGLLTMAASLGVLVIGLESVLTLHRDMNTKQSYMLFMTPNSSYKILGAKVLECSLSILVTGAFFFALGALDISLLFAEDGGLNQIWDMIQDVLQNIMIAGHTLTIDTPTMAAVVFNLLTAWILAVTTAYLADVVSSALLNGKKFNGLLSFALFMLLTWFTDWTTRKITSGINATIPLLLTFSLISLGFAIVMYVVTAQIMERKLSV
ncbi:MAG: hypothetical protein IKH30_19395 [Clostridia bacterium]|nr:hypothetical protein [Clostridia bacterium]MBR4538517.1 hypothetical protein [Clostridia bacterium]